MNILARIERGGALAFLNPERTLALVAQAIVGQDPAHALSKALSTFAFEVVCRAVESGSDLSAAMERLDEEYRAEQKRRRTDAALVLSIALSCPGRFEVAVNGAAEVVRWGADGDIETLAAPQSVAAAAAMLGSPAPETMETMSARALGFGAASDAEVRAVQPGHGDRIVIASRPLRLLRPALEGGEGAFEGKAGAIADARFAGGMALMALRP